VTLPPIPDRDRAYVYAVFQGLLAEQGLSDGLLAAIDRTWPRLYAAALRHAADRFNEEAHPARANAADQLREWASEV
jgi:hypothetical protein